MKRNWYACGILLALAFVLATGRWWLNQACDAVQHNAVQAFALGQQGEYPAAQRQYDTALHTLQQSRAGLALLVRRNLLDALEQTLATLRHYANADNTADLAVEHARAMAQLTQLRRSFLGCF